MRAPAIAIGLLWLSCNGCASVPMASPRVPSGARTVTVVGDRPVKVASGEPGATESISADPATPMEVDRRIAGRVVDETGDPVPDAVIRLAVDGAGAGRSVEVTTDAAGRFGLSSLRRGSEYTLIAEWQDEQGELLSGRRIVVAPESNVEIVLREPRRAGGVSTVSERNEAASEGLPAPASPRLAKDAGMSHPEDELPPAPEAEELIGEARMGMGEPDGFAEPFANPEDVLGPPSAASASSGMVWRRPGSIRPLDEAPGTSRAATSPATMQPIEEAEGENPLPPAREPGTNGGKTGRAGLAGEMIEDEPGKVESLAGSGSAPPPFPADPSDHPNQGSSEPVPASTPAPPPSPVPAAPAEGAPAPSEALIDAALNGQGTPSQAPPAPTESTPTPAPATAAPAESVATPEPLMPDLPATPETKGAEETPPAMAEPPALPEITEPDPGPEPPTTPAPDAPPPPPPIADTPKNEAAPLEPKPNPAPEPAPTPELAPTPEPTPAPGDSPTPAPEKPDEPDAPPPIADEGDSAPKPEPAPEPKGEPEPTPVPSEPKSGADADAPPSADAETEGEDKTVSRSSPAPRITWGQLSDQIEQRIRRSPSAIVEQASLESLAPREPSVPVERASRPAPAAATPFTKASCSYDARHRKLESFALSDVNGKEVHMADLDAKLILIDFWGTWCAPCMKAIPELIALQRDFGSAGLAVVGVAYEQGEPADWPKRIGEATEPLGVNYRLLMGEADGRPCPLRAAFQVQVFPTLVLIDGSGQVLWRDQGATDANMRRLRRIIEAKLKTNLAAREPATLTR